jgi:hypothetical protein
VEEGERKMMREMGQMIGTLYKYHELGGVWRS